MEFPLDMKHHVARKHIGIGLRAGLSVDAVKYVAEIVKYVEAVGHECQATSQHGIARLRVPYTVGLVERAVGVASAGIHSKVGIDAKSGRETEVSFDAVKEVLCREILEALPPAGKMADTRLALKSNFAFTKSV